MATRLRDLRENRWRGRSVKQRELAAALGIRDSNISAWESLTGTAIPTLNRLLDIATFFATPRSLTSGEPCLLTADLTIEEEGRRDQLFSELTELHRQAVGTTPAPRTWHPWHYPAGSRIRLICGEQAADHRSRYADENDDNYLAMSRFGDLDALFDLYGYLCRENPGSDIQPRLAGELSQEDLQSELVVLGNLAWLQDWQLDVGETRLPIRQVPSDDLAGEVFETGPASPAAPRRFLPRFATGSAPRRLVEDVGLFVQQPSPLNSNRTLTWCSGVFTRGVLGTARLLIDPDVAQSNLAWLSEHFSKAPTFGLLVRVSITGRHVVTPNISDPRNRMLAFAGAGNAVRILPDSGYDQGVPGDAMRP